MAILHEFTLSDSNLYRYLAVELFAKLLGFFSDKNKEKLKLESHR